MNTVPVTDTAAATSRTARLDRLPVTRAHVRLLLGSGVGWVFDAMDVGLISFVIAQLGVVWGLSDATRSWIASAGFVGMALGAALGGLLADRVGRRQVFALTLLVYGLATGASALAWSVGVLIALRVVVGLGLGAELPVASTLVSEFAPPRIRGRAVVVLESFWAVGWTLSALVGYLVVPHGDTGWRWALALGAVPALYAVVVRRGLPESVRFLESRRRHDEAEAVVRAFEASPAVGSPSPVVASEPEVVVPERGPDEATSAPAPAGGSRGGLAEVGTARPDDGGGRLGARVGALWTRGLRRRTAALWLVWFTVNFAYYGAFIWLPSLLAADHTLVRSFEYTLLITLGQLPGYAAAAVLIEVWGRRRTLATFLVGSAAAAAWFAAAGSDGTVVAAGILLSFFNLGAWGALYAVTPELYPTPVRTTGAGWAAGVGRIASVVAPLVVPPLRTLGGTTLLFVVFAAVFVVAAAGSLVLPERAGRTLDA